ncbi:MAG: TM2 domain-containing protein [Flavobacteriales bacterium]|nr:TM2 domain-containing protein [Flavobacteriales bacterium]
MDQNILMSLPGLEAEELVFIKNATQNLTEKQAETFLALYKSKRREHQMILILTLVGFFAVAGIQRFMLGQIGMGLLYLFTFGLCGIGTIVDLINHKKMTLEYNQKQIDECVTMAKAIS